MYGSVPSSVVAETEVTVHGVKIKKDNVTMSQYINDIWNSNVAI